MLFLVAAEISTSPQERKDRSRGFETHLHQVSSPGNDARYQRPSRKTVLEQRGEGLDFR